MSVSTPIRAHIAALRRRYAEARVFGVRTELRWPEGETLTIGDVGFHVAQCESPLAMREALLDAAGDPAPLVILTDLDEDAVGQDVLNQLARRRLFEIAPWNLLKDLFGAHGIDPRIYGRKWMAQALLDLVPLEGYAPVPSGVLTADRVWEVLLERGLGLRAARPDGQDLLRWTMSADDVSRYAGLSTEFKAGLTEWLGETAGALGSVLLACVAHGHAGDAVAIGLVCETIFAEVTPAPSALAEAGIRLERFTGRWAVPANTGRPWAVAARQVIQGQAQAGELLARADEILGELGAGDCAYLSESSPRGFLQRMERFGRAVVGTVANPTVESLAQTEDAALQVLSNARVAEAPDRAARVEMSLRLLRWLATSGKADITGDNLDAVVGAYAQEGGFVDWAREVVVGGDADPIVAQAYQNLLRKVASRRELENERFARLLAGAAGDGAFGKNLLPVESFLGTVLIELADRSPVLLVVMDGLSWAVYRELADDLRRHHWQEIWFGEGEVPSLLAGFPSITAVSRSSLLCGNASVGTAADEKSRFQAHPGLVGSGRVSHPPRLFHKGDLGAGGSTNLASVVVDEVRSTHRRVVGVVLNAVDDHLTKGEQVSVAWTLQAIPLLGRLLELAEESGRLVVIASDHGHVLDRGMESRPSTGDGERYRRDHGKLLPDEVLLSGGRVLLPEKGRVVMPWSEEIRYKARKNGYHGGVSLPEMVAPLAVISPRGTMPSGCKEIPPYEPSWWPIYTRSSGADQPSKLPSTTPERLASAERQEEFTLVASDIR